MSTVLIVDGSDVCRAPIIEFALQKQFAGDGSMAETSVASRGLEATGQGLICDLAAGRLGATMRAATFSVSHRSRPLTAADVEQADLVLTAERVHHHLLVIALQRRESRVELAEPHAAAHQPRAVRTAIDDVAEQDDTRHRRPPRGMIALDRAHQRAE